jgi:hypothetical protein
MRRMTLIRCGVASVLLGGVVAVGMLAAGCGGDDNSGTPGGGDDSGADVTTQPPPGDDGSAGEDGGKTNPDGGDANTPPPPVHGKVILVHASAFAPALRFCYGSVNAPDGGDAGTVAMVPGYPSPNTALGVPPGTGGPAADTSVDLKDRTLEIYAINSAAPGLAGQLPPADGGVSAELTCDKLIGAKALAADAGGPVAPLVQGVDYWDIGQLPAGTLADGTTTLLAVTGCAPGQVDGDKALVECPSPYDPSAGNLSLWSAKLDTTSPLDGGSIGAQFAYASYPFSLVSGTKGGVGAIAGFYLNTTTTIFPDAGVTDGGDAGDAAVEAAAPVVVPVTVPFPITEGATYGTLSPAAAAPVSGVTFDGTSGFFVNSVTADGGPAFILPGVPLNVALPLPGIQALSVPSADAGIFANGAGYVFILVGDPTAPSFVGVDGGASTADAGEFNLFSAHILGFPSNPPFGN